MSFFFWIWISTWRSKWDKTSCGMLDYVLFCLDYGAPPVTPKCHFEMWDVETLDFGRIVVKEESGMQAVLWALNWRRDCLQTGLNLLWHKWSSIWICEWVNVFLSSAHNLSWWWMRWLSELCFLSVCVLCFREVLKYYPVVQIFYIYTPVFLYMNNVLWLLLLLFDTK